MKVWKRLVEGWSKFRAATVVQAATLGVALALGATMIGFGVGASAKPLGGLDPLGCGNHRTNICGYTGGSGPTAPGQITRLPPRPPRIPPPGIEIPCPDSLGDLCEFWPT